MEMYKINVAFMPTNRTSVLQLMNQGVILTFKSSYLRKTFLKAIAAQIVISLMDQLQTFWKGFSILDAIKNICDLWEEGKISTLTGIRKKLVSALMDDFEGLKSSVHM